MDPLLYLNEIKMLASIAFSYILYRNLASTQANPIQNQDQESNIQESLNIQEDVKMHKNEQNHNSQQKIVLKANQQAVVDEEIQIQDSNKYRTDNTQEVFQVKKQTNWNRLRRAKNRLSVKIKKMKKNKRKILRQKISSL